MSIQNYDGVVSALRELFRHLPRSRQRAIVPLLILMLVGAVAEVVTIGALLPFLAVIADPEGSPVLHFIAPVLDLFNAREPSRAIYLLTGLFALAAVIAGGIRLLLLWTSQRFVYGISYDLTVGLYSGALYEPYTYHIQRNSSEIIAAINKVQIVTNSVLVPLMQGGIALIIASFIGVGLIAVDPPVALVAGVGFAVIYLIAVKVTGGKLRRNSGVIAQAQGRRIKAMQEGLGGIRDVIIDQLQPVFVETYESAEVGYRDARVRNAFIAGAPRFIVEAAGMIMIAAVAVLIIRRPGGIVEAIPVLGVLALGAQRLLPLIQQIYNGWAQVAGNRQVLFDIVGMLRKPALEITYNGPALPFENSICLDKVSFCYSEERAPALDGINLEITKGARIGIAGKTGSGKSTLMDLVLGLLEPSDGEIRIDGVALTSINRPAWRKNIAHVPQFIYLADASISENIAFGVRPEEIDHERVRHAAEQAALAEVIAALPEGYNTRVGERGVQLSGGQRQRIGIARAFYRRPQVLVLDEATSALDNLTEQAVMETIGNIDPEITTILIAHRLSTVRYCDRIYLFEKGRLAGHGTYDELVSRNTQFRRMAGSNN